MLQPAAWHQERDLPASWVYPARDLMEATLRAWAIRDNPQELPTLGELQNAIRDVDQLLLRTVQDNGLPNSLYETLVHACHWTFYLRMRYLLQAPQMVFTPMAWGGGGGYYERQTWS